jgi:hypothetical protein
MEWMMGRGEWRCTGQILFQASLPAEKKQQQTKKKENVRPRPNEIGDESMSETVVSSCDVVVRSFCLMIV